MHFSAAATAVGLDGLAGLSPTGVQVFCRFLMVIFNLIRSAPQPSLIMLS